MTAPDDQRRGGAGLPVCPLCGMSVPPGEEPCTGAATALAQTADRPDGCPWLDTVQRRESREGRGGAAGGAPAGGAVLTAAARDVLAERRRQMEAEGWTPDHDDQHRLGEICYAAAAYAINAGYEYRSDTPVSVWPWQKWAWKPTTRRRDLVKAGALILAELERLDRAEGRLAGGGAGREGR